MVVAVVVVVVTVCLNYLTVNSEGLVIQYLPVSSLHDGSIMGAVGLWFNIQASFLIENTFSSPKLQLVWFCSCRKGYNLA